MSITKQRTLDYLEHEWGTYVERFQRLPKDVQEKRVKNNGYESFRDMLAHILSWWEEGMGIIRAIAEEREFERKKYDFDVFNAEAVARYKGWDETKFMTHFKKTRQQMAADFGSMSDAVFENRRVNGWLKGIVFSHAREHLVALSRFLTLDVLDNEWSEYIENYNKLDEARKNEFITKQGFNNFHDLLAHIIGWWEEGIRVITGIMGSPDFKWSESNADDFNRVLVKKFSSWTDDELYQHFNILRLTLRDMVADLPDDAFLNRDIEGWLAADVVEHYDEHMVPA